jgi:hypothetical protein
MTNERVRNLLPTLEIACGCETVARQSSAARLRHRLPLGMVKLGNYGGCGV